MQVPGPILTVRGLCKSFGGNQVLKGVDLEVRKGEVVMIIGPSGSGKSTLLRSINMLERPTSGYLSVNNHELCWGTDGSFQVAPERDIRKVRAKVPIVFQHFNLFKHLSVLENLVQGPVHVLGRSRKEALATAREMLAAVGLADKGDAYPAELSGGQQQRVGIARALAMHPDMILFDEPTSALDPELVSGILDVIRELADRGMTMVIVTHEMSFARRLGDTIHFMEAGEIIASGSPQELFSGNGSARVNAFLNLIAPSP
jgi:ABC-type polar amino acid transport system ATPase subunit